jgi:hypothetical protein
MWLTAVKYVDWQSRHWGGPIAGIQIHAGLFLTLLLLY